MTSVDDTVDSFQFIPPPEAPVFEPTEEEFADPLAYIAKIRPIAVKTGICRIRPPKDWKPPFAVDIDTFRFIPRIQRLYELEAQSRIKLNFICNLAQFNRLQGKEKFRVPNVLGRHLDLYKLHKLVSESGGYDVVCNQRKWSQIAEKMGYPQPYKVISSLRTNYERVLLPYDLTMSGLNHDPQNLKNIFPLKPGKLFEAVETSSQAAGKKRKRTSDEIVVPPSLDMIDPTDTRTIKELKNLKFYGPGPKALLPSTSSNSSTHEGDSIKLEDQPSSPIDYHSLPLEKIDAIVCGACGRGDDEEVLLICGTAKCNRSYHMYCLVPPLSTLPKEEWSCPVCVQRACSRPPEEFGFPQSQTNYTLAEFGHKADLFKNAYFQRECYQVSYSEVEREFWRVLQSFNEDVVVEYGADIHSSKTGSGFPVQETVEKCAQKFGNLDLVEKHEACPWNLNRLPVLDKSILRFVKGDISGMKVPWCYVGMVFSSFCWHIEDHWSYSINYLHWGEPKTWYGVSGLDADKFEEAMRKQAPELFAQSPDLLHHITTIMNPNLLQAEGVRIYRTDQQAGDFIVTFPRSYHAGFNQGFNFAEAVNFCTADWLPMGRACIDHYMDLHRPCVFSHDELLFAMAEDHLARSSASSSSSAAASSSSSSQLMDMCTLRTLFEEMEITVKREMADRKALTSKGIQVHPDVVLFEDYHDDARMCEVCATTCYLSAVTCDCLATLSASNSASTAKKVTSGMRSLSRNIRKKPEEKEVVEEITEVDEACTSLPNSKMMGKSAPRKGHSELYCVKHALEVGCCPIGKKTLLCRYTVEEMQHITRALGTQLHGLGEWEAKATSTMSLDETKAYLEEGKAAGFHESRAYRMKDALCTMATTLQNLLPQLLSILKGEMNPNNLRGAKRHVQLFLIDRDLPITEVTFTEFVVDLKCVREEDISRVLQLWEEIPFPEVKASLRETYEEMQQLMSRLSTWRVELRQILSAPHPSSYPRLKQLCEEAGSSFNIALPEFEYLDLFGKGLQWLYRVSQSLPHLPLTKEKPLTKGAVVPVVSGNPTLPITMWLSLSQVLALCKEATQMVHLRQQLDKKKPAHSLLLAPLFTQINERLLPLRALSTAAETIHREAQLCLGNEDEVTNIWQPPCMSALENLVKSCHELQIRVDSLNRLRLQCWVHWYDIYVAPLDELKKADTPRNTAPKCLSYSIAKNLNRIGCELVKEGLVPNENVPGKGLELQQPVALFEYRLKQLRSAYQINEEASDVETHLLQALLPRQFVDNWGSDSPCAQFFKTFNTVIESCHGFSTEEFTFTMANTYRRLLEEEQSSLLNHLKVTGSPHSSGSSSSSTVVPLLTQAMCFLCLREENLSDTPLNGHTGFQLRLCQRCFVTRRPPFSVLLQLDAAFEKEALISELSLALRALLRRIMQWLESVENLVLTNRELVQPILHRLHTTGQCHIPAVLLAGYTFPTSSGGHEEADAAAATSGESAEELAVLRPHLMSLLRVGLCFEVDVWPQLNLLLCLLLYLESSEETMHPPLSIVATNNGTALECTASTS